jgi:D-arabinose 1-dehydrogenase-like Zn-dependent alcohol dehydrogenase
MKAAIVERPGCLVVRDLPDPRLGEYDALCRILYGATCTGTDTHLIRGSFPFPISYPSILGHESVGRVIEVGSKVRNLKEGDFVTRVGAPPTGDVDVCWGGFAELGIAKDHWAMAADGLPPAQWTGHRVNQVVPRAIDPRVAPMFTTWRENLSYLTRMGVGAGARVLVIGSGGNGLSFARLSVLLGALAWVVGSARLEESARGLGIAGFIDYTRPDVAKPLAEAFPEGFSHLVDSTGKAGQADRFLPCLTAGGKVGIYGMDDYSSASLTPHRARGPFTVWPAAYDEAETHQRVCELALQGKLVPDPWYDPERTFPLERIHDAFEELWTHRGVKALIAIAP